ncbi:putative signal transduction protein with CBS domains [Methanobacterium paludis]|uniref:Signal transduction protein with CBS domains n=2 Tax=Methanobacterium paludis (strain DSM 25820 / JCM 18151 / SWAN1) TaxID=868131 RepID=F6D3N4_METPW|nr:putative signal transduction protein with CBS domains [Methanobacterium paludis]
MAGVIMLVKEIMSEDIHYIQVPGNRTNAMELMRDKNVSGLPVVKNGTKELVGILTRTDLVENPDEEQIAMIMTRNPITVAPDDDIKEVATKMIENNIRRIPITENGVLIGLLTASDLVNKALWKMDVKDPVENYMLRKIPTTWEKTPLNIAFDIMKYFNLKVVLALNKDGKLSGILTETDFIEESEVVAEQTVHNTSVGTEGDKWSWDSKSVLYVTKNHLKFSDKEVKDVATTEPIIATTKTSVKECANKMKQKNIEQIPVIDVEGNLVGLVRATDLIKAISD